MKRYLLFSLLLVVFVSCKKDKNPPSIVGTWEIRSQYGMMPTIFFTPGNDTIVKFTGNTYERFIDGARVANGTYRLTKDTYQTSVKGNRIIFDNVTTDRTFYNLRGDTLSFFTDPDFQDGAGASYKRINP